MAQNIQTPPSLDTLLEPRPLDGGGIRRPETTNQASHQRPSQDDSNAVVLFSKKEHDEMHDQNFDDVLSHRLAFFVQTLGTIFFRILFNIFFKIEITGKEVFKNAPAPLLIVSNHIAPYDSFMFHLFFTPFHPTLPLRFMAVSKFHDNTLNLLYKIGIIPVIYKLFGVFTIIQGAGVEAALKNAKRIIHQGGTVTIFPEGKMFKKGEVGPFKWGAAILALSTDTTIVPVSVRKFPRRFRSRIRINVGTPMKLTQGTKPEDATEELRTHIINLYSKF